MKDRVRCLRAVRVVASMPLLALALPMAIAGCDRSLPVAASPVSAELVAGPTSFISVSDDAPAVGSEVVVVGNAERAGDRVLFGSFRAQLHYDRVRLEFLGEAPLPGAMRAINPDSGRVTVAGAAANGFVDGRLFALRFRVRQLHPFEAMLLTVDELNGVDYLSRLRVLRTKSAVQRDRAPR